MQSKKLAALLSSLVSQLILLLSLTSDSHDLHNCHSDTPLSPLIHLLSLHQLTASLALSKKRKRTHFSEPDSDPTHVDGDRKLGYRIADLGRVAPNPDSFRSFFKMSSSSFEWLSGLLEPLLDCRDPIGSPLNLSAELRLGIGLFRLATGSDYSQIAARFGVTESATRFCARQLCRVLCTNFRFWVAFPNCSELELISEGFESLTGLPNCCGVMDCTRFKFVGKSDSDLVHSDSIAVQIVVDSSSRILSIVAGFRGDKDDYSILKSTTLYQDIERGRLLNSDPIMIAGTAVSQYLVGDFGYPLLPRLMVPFVDVEPESCEEKFNKAYELMHLSALRTIASLKNWGVLSKPIEEEFKTVVAFIGACAILHNALLMREDDSALVDIQDYSLYDEDSWYHSDSMMEENLMERKASDVRNALATRVTEFHKS